jgi:hypothetical protein
MNRTILLRAAVVSLVAACVGCPASLEDPGRFADVVGPCPDVPQDVFIKVCSTAGCHNPVDKMLGLDLQSPDVASRLVGVPAMGGPGLLVDPSSPSSSILYTKLTATPPFGARMPFSESPLPDATIACVLQWITLQLGDAGSEDGAAEASGDDGPEMADASPTPGEDAASDDGGPEDATAPFDGGKAPDARAPVKDASSPPTPDASVRDASPPADAKTD